MPRSSARCWPTCTIGYLRSPPSAQEAGHQLDRVLCRGKPDAQRRLRSSADQGSRAQPVFAADQRVEPFQGERQVGAALVIGNRVDLVDDHGLDRAKIVAALLRCQQDVERLRRGDENVRRPFEHGPAFRGQRIAGAHRGADGRAQVAARQGQFLNLPQRHLQVLLHIVAERFERRDVDHRRGRCKRAIDGLADQLIDTDEKRGQRLARAGRGGDQRRPSREDRRPAQFLGRGGGAELAR